jgi:surface carbohydrate biosynthesis protein
MQKKTRVYLPIETKVREFDAKLLLSCTVAEAGYDVVLGHQKMMLKKMENMPRGILIDKSVLPRKIKKYGYYKKLGFKVTAYDEEGLIPWSPEEYQRLRQFSNETLKPLEYFFAWGQWHVDFVSNKAPVYQDKIIPVGHPRLDLTRRELRAFYDDEVSKLRNRYGQFILINSNFALCNHFYGEEGFVEVKKKVWDEQLIEFYLKISAHQQKLFDAFTEMIIAIRQCFPGISVVLRPHPSENHDSWRQVLPQDEQIAVVHEGNIVPWIMAATIAIHNSCTTGVEAYLLEQPVIAYRPVQDKSLEKDVPNELSEQAFTLNALLNRVEYFLANGQDIQSAGDARKREIAVYYITGLEGPLSCDRIVDSLNKVQFSRETLSSSVYQLYTKAKNVGRRIVRGEVQQNTSHHSEVDLRTEYKSQKFPGIELDEIHQAIAKFHHLTGRFAEVRVRQLVSNKL